MSSRMLKELKGLAPWQWDSRVQKHPPGSKALSDFERVEHVMLHSEPGQARTRQSTGEPGKDGTPGPIAGSTPFLEPAPRRRSASHLEGDYILETPSLGGLKKATSADRAKSHARAKAAKAAAAAFAAAAPEAGGASGSAAPASTPMNDFGFGGAMRPPRVMPTSATTPGPQPRTAPASALHHQQHGHSYNQQAMGQMQPPNSAMRLHGTPSLATSQHAGGLALLPPAPQATPASAGPIGAGYWPEACIGRKPLDAGEVSEKLRLLDRIDSLPMGHTPLPHHHALYALPPGSAISTGRQDSVQRKAYMTGGSAQHAPRPSPYGGALADATNGNGLYDLASPGAKRAREGYALQHPFLQQHQQMHGEAGGMPPSVRKPHFTSPPGATPFPAPRPSAAAMFSPMPPPGQQSGRAGGMAAPGAPSPGLAPMQCDQAQRPDTTKAHQAEEPGSAGPKPMDMDGVSACTRSTQQADSSALTAAGNEARPAKRMAASTASTAPPAPPAAIDAGSDAVAATGTSATAAAAAPAAAAPAPAAAAAITAAGQPVLSAAQLAVLNQLLQHFRAIGCKHPSSMTGPEIVRAISSFCQSSNISPRPANIKTLASWLGTLLSLDNDAMEALVAAHAAQAQQQAQQQQQSAAAVVASAMDPADAAAAAAAPAAAPAPAAAAAPAAASPAARAPSPAPAAAPPPMPVPQLQLPLHLLGGNSLAGLASAANGPYAATDGLMPLPQLLSILPLDMSFALTTLPQFEAEWNAALTPASVALHRLVLEAHAALTKAYEAATARPNVVIPAVAAAVAAANAPTAAAAARAQQQQQQAALPAPAPVPAPVLQPAALPAAAAPVAVVAQAPQSVLPVPVAAPSPAPAGIVRPIPQRHVPAVAMAVAQPQQQRAAPPVPLQPQPSFEHYVATAQQAPPAAAAAAPSPAVQFKAPAAAGRDAFPGFPSQQLLQAAKTPAPQQHHAALSVAYTPIPPQSTRQQPPAAAAGAISISPMLGSPEPGCGLSPLCSVTLLQPSLHGNNGMGKGGAMSAAAGGKENAQRGAPSAAAAAAAAAACGMVIDAPGSKAGPATGAMAASHQPAKMRAKAIAGSWAK